MGGWIEGGGGGGMGRGVGDYPSGDNRFPVRLVEVCSPPRSRDKSGQQQQQTTANKSNNNNNNNNNCNEWMKSYFSHTYASLQSLVPTLSPLLVRFLRVYLQADPSRLLVATAARKHQSRITQSSSKRSYKLLDPRMKPPTMPHGNDSCTQARFAVTNACFRSSSRSFFPRLVLRVFLTEARAARFLD